MQTLGGKVLILENDLGWQSLLQKAVEEAPGVGFLATSPDIASGMVSEHCFDAALIDKSMKLVDSGDEGGYGIAKMLKVQDPDCRVGVVTAFGKHDNIKRAYEEVGAEKTFLKVSDEGQVNENLHKEVVEWLREVFLSQAQRREALWRDLVKLIRPKRFDGDWEGRLRTLFKVNVANWGGLHGLLRKAIFHYVPICHRSDVDPSWCLDSERGVLRLNVWSRQAGCAIFALIGPVAGVEHYMEQAYVHQRIMDVEINKVLTETPMVELHSAVFETRQQRDDFS